MTNDEIINLAIKNTIHGLKFDEEGLLRFAKLIAQNEREACAQILANTDLSGLRDHPLQNWVGGMLFEFIKAIRARGQA